MRPRVCVKVCACVCLRNKSSNSFFNHETFDTNKQNTRKLFKCQQPLKCWFIKILRQFNEFRVVFLQLHQTFFFTSLCLV